MSSDASDIISRSLNSGGYSAQVRIKLHVNGQIYRVAQIGGGRLIFDSPVTFPKTVGTVVMTVDGNEKRWHVEIPGHAEPTRIVEANIISVPEISSPK
jgi:hypothetical protein